MTGVRVVNTRRASFLAKMEILIFAILAAVITYVFIKAIEHNRYFDKWGIPQVKSSVPFLGFMGSNVFKREHMNDIVKKLYSVNKEAKYVGCHMLNTPVIAVRDLDLIKSVLVKNFDSFSDHKDFVEEANDPLFGKNLAFLNGERWREVRNLLSPAFTSSKMRLMFTLMEQCAENFMEQFLDIYGSKEAIDMKDVYTRYTNDVIATCAFGIEVDSLKDPSNDFYTHGRSATASGVSGMFKFFLMRACPTFSRAIGLRVVSKEDTDFFVNVIETTMKVRDERAITRPDMLQLMMDARGKSKNLDLLEITAQAFIFFLGGFESTSTNLCMISYELALNPEVQKKLQDEIDNMMKQCSNKPTYELVNNLPYLDAVFTEILRMHSISFLNRMCSKEFELPPALPGSKPYLMKPGMELIIPVSGIHEDPDFYDNPKKFDPDRHSDKKAVMTDVTSLGFGLGPRMCIGNRFAILESKVVLVQLLSKCSLVPCKKTCIPLEYDKKNFVPSVKGGCWLKIERRS